MGVWWRLRPAMAKAKASKRKAAAAAGADAAAAAAAGAAAAAPVAAVAAAPAGTPRGGGKRRKAVAVGEDVRTPRSAARGGGGGGGGRGALSETVYESDDEAEACQNMPWMESVVKIFCMHVEPNFSLPWQRKRQYQSTGSGFAIAGGRILTNAHCVDHHTQVKVRRRGDDAKYIARVLAVGVECDLALLAVDDEEFHKGLEPLPFGTLPRLHSAVTVVGYPLGGDTISVTSGVVSRVEVTAYAHGASELLGVQIDAAINSGNSGGPAFNGRGECVGVAFQSLKSDDAEVSLGLHERVCVRVSVVWGRAGMRPCSPSSERLLTGRWPRHISRPRAALEHRLCHSPARRATLSARL